jgi:hypothetical protein
MLQESAAEHSIMTLAAGWAVDRLAEHPKKRVHYPI